MRKETTAFSRHFPCMRNDMSQVVRDFVETIFDQTWR